MYAAAPRSSGIVIDENLCRRKQQSVQSHIDEIMKTLFLHLTKLASVQPRSVW